MCSASTARSQVALTDFFVCFSGLSNERGMFFLFFFPEDRHKHGTKQEKRQYCICKGCPSRLSNVTSVLEHQKSTASDVDHQRGENDTFEIIKKKKFYERIQSGILLHKVPMRI